MADLSQTPANVESGAGASTAVVQAGEALEAGMPVYQASTGKYLKADANDATAYDAKGIALCGASSDGYFILQTSGPMNIGATTTQGEIYVASATAGGIAPCSDIASGWYPVVLGMATDTSGNITMSIKT